MLVFSFSICFLFTLFVFDWFLLSFLFCKSWNAKYSCNACANSLYTWVATALMHIVSKTGHIFSTLSKFCDFFWNALIKTNLSLSRQLCGHSNSFQSLLDATCFYGPPGDGSQGSFWRLIQVSELIGAYP